MIESFKISPKKIFLMVPAGEIVDLAIQMIKPFLNQDDIVMDGGNSYFEDSNRRYHELQKEGINFFGVGVSGGEKGALTGPSIMPSGNKKVYPQIAPILKIVAAKKIINHVVHILVKKEAVIM